MPFLEEQGRGQATAVPGVVPANGRGRDAIDRLQTSAEASNSQFAVVEGTADDGVGWRALGSKPSIEQLSHARLSANPLDAEIRRNPDMNGTKGAYVLRAVDEATQTLESACGRNGCGSLILPVRARAVGVRANKEGGKP